MTLGADVARWAKLHLDVDLYPWQVGALTGMLEVDSDQALRHRWALVSTARQNGKTRGLLAPLVGWWLTEGRVWRGDDAQQVISCAHKIGVAEDVARTLFPVLEESFGFKTFVSAGRMEAHHPDGARWRIEAANARAGHGTSNDLVIADEIWKIDSEVIETGLLPTQRARPNPFALFVSTAGTEQSQFFMRWRERGIAAIEAGEPGRLYMAEWSPPSNAMADDRQYWHLGNPAIGLGALTLQDLEDEYAQPDRDNFMRSSLNLWTSAVGSWLPPGTWEKLTTTDPMPAGGWLAIDSDQTDLRYCGVRVVARTDGRLQARSEFVVESVGQLWTEVANVMQDKTVQLLATPGLAAICPVDLQRRLTMFGQREVTQYTGLVRSLILEGKVLHAGQTSMTEHVNRAVAGRAGPAITLTSARSPGPIEMARCMVAAAGLAARPTSAVRKPMIGIAH
jgi:hypothetical protein